MDIQDSMPDSMETDDMLPDFTLNTSPYSTVTLNIEDVNTTVGSSNAPAQSSANMPPKNTEITISNAVQNNFGQRLPMAGVIPVTCLTSPSDIEGENALNFGIGSSEDPETSMSDPTQTNNDQFAPVPTTSTITCKTAALDTENTKSIIKTTSGVPLTASVAMHNIPSQDTKIFMVPPIKEQFDSLTDTCTAENLQQTVANNCNPPSSCTMIDPCMTTSSRSNVRSHDLICNTPDEVGQNTQDPHKTSLSNNDNSPGPLTTVKPNRKNVQSRPATSSKTMVIRAFEMMAAKGRNSLSLRALKKFICKEYSLTPKQLFRRTRYIKKFLRYAIETNQLIPIRGTGLTASFRVSPKGFNKNQTSGKGAKKRLLPKSKSS